MKFLIIFLLAFIVENEGQDLSKSCIQKAKTVICLRFYPTHVSECVAKIVPYFDKVSNIMLNSSYCYIQKIGFK